MPAGQCAAWYGWRSGGREGGLAVHDTHAPDTGCPQTGPGQDVDTSLRAARARVLLRARTHDRESRRLAGKRRRGRTIIVRVLLALVLMLGCLAGGALWRVRQGPIAADAIAERVAEALEARFGAGFDVAVRHAQVAWGEDGPVLAVSGVTVRDAAGNLVVAAPQADIAFDPAGLLTAQLKPRDISFIGLAVVLTIAPDGTISISATGDDDPNSDAAVPQAPPSATFGPASVLDVFAAKDGPLAVLERAGIRDGRIRINDRRRNRTVIYDRTSVGFARPSPDAVQVRLSANGPNGTWSAQASVAGEPGKTRSLRFEVDNLSLAELLGFTDESALPATTDMPIRGFVALSLTPDNAIATFEGKIAGGSAMILFSDPDAEPIFVDTLRGSFGWDGVTHAILVNDLQMEAGDTRWKLVGRVGVPQQTGEFWTVSLASGDSMMAADSPAEEPVAIDRLLLEGRLPIGLSAFHLDRLEIAGPQLSLAANGFFGKTEQLDGVRLGLTAGRMPVRNLLAFWPSPFAADVRTWMLDNALGGTVEKFALAVSLSSQALADGMAKKPLPDDGVSLDVAVSGGVLRPGPGLPVLRDMAATGRVTGRTTRIQASKALAAGPAQALALTNGRFEIADTTRHPPVATLEFDVGGPAEAVFDVLKSPALKPFVALPSDLAALRGRVDAKVKTRFPIDTQIDPRDVSVQLSGQATAVAADNLFGREKLEGGTFSFTQDKAGLLVTGEGKLGGTPATFEMRQASGSPVSDVTVQMVLDEAARTRRGLKLSGQVTGPVEVRIAVHDASSAKPTVKVETDFAKAAIAELLPGWSKPAGKPGKASFRLDSDGDTTVLDEFALDSTGGVSMRGSIRLAADGALASARLTSLKLSPGDDMRLDLDRTGALTKVTARAVSIDARPLLRALMAPGGPALGNPGDLDVDLTARTVVGENNERLSAADLKLGLRSGEIRDFRLAGRFNQSPVSGQTARGEGGQAGIVVESGDAGTFLRFLDIYRRMLGGTLIVQLFGAPPTMSGAIIANTFILANEPALARTAGVEPGKPANVAFTKLKGSFAVGGGRLEIKDGTMWGTAVGGTLDGTMDFNRDRLDLSGTFVPAYGLNNALNRVPIVGTILGGGQNEGIFAVNFRITGRLSQPSLSINPLSAVAPGVLRKFFGVFGPGAPDEAGDDRPKPLGPPMSQR